MIDVRFYFISYKEIVNYIVDISINSILKLLIKGSRKIIRVRCMIRINEG